MEQNSTESVEESIGAMTQEDLLALGKGETAMFAHLDGSKQKQLAEIFSFVTSSLGRMKLQPKTADYIAEPEALANA